MHIKQTRTFNGISGQSETRLVVHRTFVMLLAFSLIGCPRKANETLVPDQVPAAKEQSEPVAKNEKAEAKYPEEVYGDPSIFKGPRFQFLWSPKGEETALWSTALDGSDLRRVIAPEVLSANGIVGFNVGFSKPTRSPDNRFIAAEVSTTDLPNEYLVLIDLKEKKVRRLMRNDEIPYFNWTRDSQYLFFNTSHDLQQYDVATGTFKKVLGESLWQFLLLSDDQTFMKFGTNWASFYNRKGKKVRSITLYTIEEGDFSPFSSATANEKAITPDGRLMMYQQQYVDGHGVSAIIDTKEPTKILYKDKIPRANLVFGPDPSYVYYTHAYHTGVDGLMRFNWRTGVTSNFRFPGGVRDLTLFNSK